MSELKKYFFDQDEDCHWYLIPAEHREEWNDLKEIEDAWDLDEWQKFEDCRIDGVSDFLFENPEKATSK